MAFNFKRAADELAAFTEQENALKVNVKFLTEYMVFFDSKKAEGPYNDVYMYCFIKHGLITKDTKICEKGTTKIQRAGDCDDLQDFFNLVSSIRHNNTSQETRQDSPEEELHKAWDKKMSKDLIDKFIQNAELFDTDDSAIIDEEILDSIYAQTENFDKEKGEVHFQVADFDGYAKEDLTNEQNEALKELAREVLRFLLHKEWDGTLPKELIDLAIDSNLFDDPYYPQYIDEKICSYTWDKRERQSIYGEDKRDINFYILWLEKIVIDGVKITSSEKIIIHKIAKLQYDYVHSINDAEPQRTHTNVSEQTISGEWERKLSKSLVDKFIQNAELFDTDDSAIIDEEIFESIYAQTKSFDKKRGEIHFQVTDFDGYAKEDLTNEQNEALKELAREVLRFLFHKKWDGVLPEELIDLTVDVADLFDDPYYPKYIDEKIFRFTYMDHENSSPDEKDMFEIEDMLDNLNDLIVDGVTPTPKQEKILREIATIQYNYIYS